MSEKCSIKSKMLESQLVMVLITMSGGLQDAYTYCVRDRVFANAQTGNIVLMMGRLFHGDIWGGMRYLAPLVMFSLGVLAADQIRVRVVKKAVNWWQVVVMAEAILLFATGFIPVGSPFNLMANSLVSFCCAMQIETFKKVNGCAYASTMCIGNLKSTMEALSKWMWTGDKDQRKAFWQYTFVIFCFAIGAGAGMILCDHTGQYTIMFSSLLLFAAAIALR